MKKSILTKILVACFGFVMLVLFFSIFADDGFATLGKTKAQKIDYYLAKAAKEEESAALLLKKGQVSAASDAKRSAENYKQKARSLQTPLNAPQNIHIQGDTIYWDEVELADSYRISDSKGKTYESVNKTQFKVSFNEGKSLTYYIVATAHSTYYCDSGKSSISYTPPRITVTLINSDWGVGRTQVEYLPIEGDDIIWFHSFDYKENKYFLMYYYDKELTQPYFEGTILKKDTTLYGAWTDYELDSRGGFINGRNFKGAFVVPEGVEFISEGAFKNNTELTDIVLPSTLTRIEERAFRSCSMLKSVTLSENFRWIGEEAFSSCGSLTYIEIPNSVTRIDSGAFGGCDNLTINYGGTKALWDAIKKGDHWWWAPGTAKLTIHCTDGDL